jgi:hypothetical protein
MKIENTTVMEYWALLVDMDCSKMSRAWRSRTGRTRGKWIDAVIMLLCPEKGESIEGVAACLYVACGWYAMRCGSYTFNGSAVPPSGWRVIAAMTVDFMAMKPAKAMGRGEWEASHGRQVEEDALSDWNMKA